MAGRNKPSPEKDAEASATLDLKLPGKAQEGHSDCVNSCKVLTTKSSMGGIRRWMSLASVLFVKMTVSNEPEEVLINLCLGETSLERIPPKGNSFTIKVDSSFDGRIRGGRKGARVLA